ncbi:MAG: type II secretion system GspH family protein [Fimbriimonadaceae bacterium]|nr:type II secretion system GspH family protein [Fimbriimonadaceae bacterium]
MVRQRGVTLVEVMTSVSVLALVSASLVGGLALANERTEIARQRSIVSGHVRQALEALAFSAGNTPGFTVNSSATETPEALRQSITLVRTAAPVSGRIGLVEVQASGTWQARIGSRTIPQTVAFTTRVLQAPPRTPTPALVTVPATACYLPIQDNANIQPIRINLEAAGMTPGTQIRIRVIGTYLSEEDPWDPGVHTTPTSTLGAMFAGHSTILPASESGGVRNRVPWAIVSGLPQVQGNDQGNTCTEDFQIGASPTTVTVPAGARYLFLGVLDDYYDNSGSVQVEVTRV